MDYLVMLTSLLCFQTNPCCWCKAACFRGAAFVRGQMIAPVLLLSSFSAEALVCLGLCWSSQHCAGCAVGAEGSVFTLSWGCGDRLSCQRAERAPASGWASSLLVCCCWFRLPSPVFLTICNSAGMHLKFLLDIISQSENQHRFY